jgi:hypothetical protein
MGEIPNTANYLIAGYALFAFGTAAYILYLALKWKRIINAKKDQTKNAVNKRFR